MDRGTALTQKKVQDSAKTPQVTEDEAKYKCNICPKGFTRAMILREHMRSHNNDHPFGCEECPKSFTRLKDRQRHEVTHFNSRIHQCIGHLFNQQTKMWKKWGCSSHFARRDGLRAHWQTQRGQKYLDLLFRDLMEQMRSTIRLQLERKKALDVAIYGERFWLS
ncbi:hypothetical protein B0J14DRAFT_493861 [Halenospora varia]|nr:hypothetical protein B0J14DRAFT_493861 [Halenospora varia]